MNGFSHVFGGFGLLGAECAEHSKEFVVNCPGIIEEGAYDTLDAFHTLGSEWRAGVFVREELVGCPIDDGTMGMGCMLQFAWLRVVVFE